MRARDLGGGFREAVRMEGLVLHSPELELTLRQGLEQVLVLQEHHGT